MATKNKATAAKEIQGTQETDEAGTVNIKMNPALARGCQGQIMIAAGGRNYLVKTDIPTTVSAQEYKSLSLTEVRGVKAVIRA